MWKRIRALFGSKTGVVVPGGAGIEEGTSRSIEIGDPLAGGTRVILSKVDGEVYALDSICPHGHGGHIQTGPLEEGRFAVCPLHRYLFDVTTGKPRGNVCRAARRFRVEARGEDIEVFI